MEKSSKTQHHAESISRRNQKNGPMCCLQGEELEDQAGMGRRRVIYCVNRIFYMSSLFGKTELNLKHGCDQHSGTITTSKRVGGSRLSIGKTEANMGGQESPHLALQEDWGPHRRVCHTCLLSTEDQSRRCLFVKVIMIS